MLCLLFCYSLSCKIRRCIFQERPITVYFFKLHNDMYVVQHYVRPIESDQREILQLFLYVIK